MGPPIEIVNDKAEKAAAASLAKERQGQLIMNGALMGLASVPMATCYRALRR